jgi:hypothetical protein
MGTFELVAGQKNLLQQGFFVSERRRRTLIFCEQLVMVPHDGMVPHGWTCNRFADQGRLSWVMATVT